MKAIRIHNFGHPEVMLLEETEELQPKENSVVVELYAIGVNPFDTYVRSGMVAGISLPHTPGIDAAGKIKKLGSGVKNFSVGDRVYIAGSISGTYAQQSLCHVSQIHPLPEHISFEQGAGIFIPYVTAYHALFNRAKIKPGETILIHGASGAVGLAAIQLAKTLNCTILGTGGTW